jgi:hypothetical protein
LDRFRCKLRLVCNFGQSFAPVEPMMSWAT